MAEVAKSPDIVRRIGVTALRALVSTNSAIAALIAASVEDGKPRNDALKEAMQSINESNKTIVEFLQEVSPLDKDK